MPQNLIELHYDGSATGCLCALAEACQESALTVPVFVRPGTSRALFSGGIRLIRADASRAAQFLSLVERHAATSATLALMRVVTAMPDNCEPHLLGFVRQALHKGADILRAHADRDVAFVQLWSRRVGGEIHRFKGLLRFQLCASGRYIAHYEPDYDITLPLALHFRKRLAAHRWVIVDRRRAVAATWDGHRLNAESPDGELLTGNRLSQCLADEAPSEKEAQTLALWQTFHRAIAIETRRNPHLQRRCMPVRYWKYLTELPHQ